MWPPGVKIARAARAAGTEVKAHVAAVSERFRDLFGRYDIQLDDYVRTTEPRHRAAATALWKTLQARGYIYKGVYKGWYSVSDEGAAWKSPFFSFL